MKFKNPLFVVSDMDRSLWFYQTVLGLRVTADFGTNKTLAGGICLQTAQSWPTLIGEAGKAVAFGGRDAELYFEEDDLDGFLAKIETMEGIEYVHPLIEHRWGQRAIRIYDPDRHIIEVGESLRMPMLRFAAQGMSFEQIAARMDVPLSLVERLMK